MSQQSGSLLAHGGGGGDELFVFITRGQQFSIWFMIDITNPPPAINNEWSLNKFSCYFVTVEGGVSTKEVSTSFYRNFLLEF